LPELLPQSTVVDTDTPVSARLGVTVAGVVQERSQAGPIIPGAADLIGEGPIDTSRS
jgi:hypothetical protein